MEAKIREALEDARHELATLHGLMAYDDADPSRPWALDTTGVTAKIDEALGTRWAVFALEKDGPRRLTPPMGRERAERVKANYEEMAAEDYESHPTFDVRCA